MRGVYPPDDFKMVSKYGLKLLVSKDNGLNDYLDNVMRQLRGACVCINDLMRPSPANAERATPAEARQTGS